MICFKRNRLTGFAGRKAELTNQLCTVPKEKCDLSSFDWLIWQYITRWATF
jgi:hypothetical protein